MFFNFTLTPATFLLFISVMVPVILTVWPGTNENRPNWKTASSNIFFGFMDSPCDIRWVRMDLSLIFLFDSTKKIVIAHSPRNKNDLSPSKKIESIILIYFSFFRFSLKT